MSKIEEQRELLECKQVAGQYVWEAMSSPVSLNSHCFIV